MVGSVGGAEVLIREQKNWSRIQTEWFVAAPNFIAIGSDRTNSL